MVEGRKETSLVENIVDQKNTADTVVAGIGVWYAKLAVVVGGRMRVWFWRVATGRSLCLPNHDGLSHTVSICGIAFFWGL